MNILQLKTDKLYYLASPYSSPAVNNYTEEEIRNRRARQVDTVAAQLIENNLVLIEPITMCHEKAKRHYLPSGFEYWRHRDFTYINYCDALLVVALDHWSDSYGVTEEIKYARSIGKPIFLIFVHNHKLDSTGIPVIKDLVYFYTPSHEAFENVVWQPSNIEYDEKGGQDSWASQIDTELDDIVGKSEGG